jgi:hypothetical protein
VAPSVLGINVIKRSQEKQVAAGQDFASVGGVLSGFARMIARKPA